MVISKRVGGRGSFVSDAASGAQGVVATWSSRITALAGRVETVTNLSGWITDTPRGLDTDEVLTYK